MPRYRHVIEVPGYDLPGHLARTLCGRIVAHGRMPNVPRTDPRFCLRCDRLDRGEALTGIPSKWETSMYSPKIPERFIPILYRLGRERRRPMTQLVAEAVERYLADEGCLPGALAVVRDDEAGKVEQRRAA